MSYSTSRKVSQCKNCGVKLEPGDVTYRSLLQATVNGIMRCDRICLACMIGRGRDLTYLE